MNKSKQLIEQIEFCKCRNGKPCSDTMFEIEKALENQRKAILEEVRSKVIQNAMTVKITFTNDSPFNGAVEILKNITEIHYCYQSPMSEPRTAFESDIDETGITYQNSYIKEFEAINVRRGLDENLDEGETK